ncbi:unnamed protein product [Brassicogethes aeneus]|uniref:Ankyrin repeat domain-containing protein 12 n=1 Tax=Brassicogethes aeneus TaxID=1431903 RepID=A0A9P0FBN1_BRAAE|nr:unnamed protein product [Brassicogethes aeneus]
MPSSVRPRGGSASNRGLPVTPMSERQQLALLMQMTSTGNEAGSRSPSSTNSSRSRERNERGETPLHLAAIKGDVEQVCRLLAHHADPNVADFAESTTTSRLQPRSRDDKKLTDSSKQKSVSTDETMESSKTPTNSEDVYEFKSVKESDSSPEQKASELELEADATDPLSIPTTTAEETTKRNFAEVADNSEDGGNDDESKRKKRKDEGTTKEGKTTTPRNAGPNKGQNSKQTVTGQGKAATLNAAKTTTVEKKSPCSSPKPTGSTSDAEVRFFIWTYFIKLVIKVLKFVGSSVALTSYNGKTDLKVPPLKIVIPQSSSSEQEPTSRNGKNSSQRAHQALPYVVASSNSNDANDMATAGSPDGAGSSKGEEKKEGGGKGDDERGSHQRVLRSSHRSGAQGTDRGSNNSSPQLQRSHSPSPTASPAASSNQTDAPAASTSTSTNTTAKTSDSQATQNNDVETATASPATSAPVTTAAPVELHPRKRKMKPNKEPVAPAPEVAEAPAEAQIHPHDQPITNCYQLFLNIRKQINKRRRGIYPVQPKPPQGFKDYLMNRCTYVLGGTAPNTPNISYPSTLPAPMKDLFTEQEKERYRLRMQHVIEKEKLVLSVEQEILRVHGRAARALANQSLPFSVCTILKDEEVYNLITPEQEEKDRNARSRYNGRLFLSWLQDVDDKWEKIKEHMLLRHHNEAESLHAVQKMDWEWKMKELSLCDRKSTPSIDEHHVPMVHVSDDFDLLPA